MCPPDLNNLTILRDLNVPLRAASGEPREPQHAAFHSEFAELESRAIMQDSQHKLKSLTGVAGRDGLQTEVNSRLKTARKNGDHAAELPILGEQLDMAKAVAHHRRAVIGAHGYSQMNVADAAHRLSPPDEEHMKALGEATTRIATVTTTRDQTIVRARIK